MGRPFKHQPHRPEPRRHERGSIGSDGGASQGWDPVAAWYDKLVGESGSDYHRHVILPAALRLLAAGPGHSVLDVCCGQGVLAGPLLEAGIARYTGVDASPRLIEAARTRWGKDPRVSFVRGDVCRPGDWAAGGHDRAACLMAVHDVADAAAMFRHIAAALSPGGCLVLVFMHPCFRIPKQSHWGWDGDQKIQFRRIDAYATPQTIAVTTHPGRPQSGATEFHHRPLAVILHELGQAGLAVSDCEELCSHRRSQGTGPFSKAEHKAAGEFPLFIALKAVKLGAGA